MVIGSHVSFSKRGLFGALQEAVSYNANTFMFYTGAPQNTVRKDLVLDDIVSAKAKMLDNNIDINNVICHAPYIINMATSKEEQRAFSIDFLKKEVDRCKILGVKYMVLHPGNAVGISKEEGIRNFISSVVEVINEDVTILIETMAGKGTEICSNVDELKEVFDSIDSKYLGVCLDTCHLNDSGVDLSEFDKYLDVFDSLIGIDKIKCVHLNDSKNELGTHKDRHENIGFGTIGFDNLMNVVYNERLSDIPIILETPYIEGNSPYKEEIEVIRKREFNSLLQDVVANK